MQKGTYNFIVGVKTPAFVDYPVTAKMVVAIEGVKGTIDVQLQQQTVLPFVRCCKELVNEEGVRLIKLAVLKNKSKK